MDDLLTASVLRYYNDFLDDLLCCPDHRYNSFVDDIKNNKFRIGQQGQHGFLIRLLQAAGQVGLQHNDLKQMCQEINVGFVENNFHFLPMKSLITTIGDSVNFNLDPRSFMGTLNAMSHHYSQQTAAILNQKNDLMSMKHDIELIKGKYSTIFVFIIFNLI